MINLLFYIHSNKFAYKSIKYNSKLLSCHFVVDVENCLIQIAILLIKFFYRVIWKWKNSINQHLKCRFKQFRVGIILSRLSFRKDFFKSINPNMRKELSLIKKLTLSRDLNVWKCWIEGGGNWVARKRYILFLLKLKLIHFLKYFGKW